MEIRVYKILSVICSVTAIVGFILGKTDYALLVLIAGMNCQIYAKVLENAK